MGENCFTQIFAPVTTFFLGICFSFFSISQGFSQDTLGLSPTELNFPYQGDTVDVQIAANQNWTFQTPSDRIFLSLLSGSNNNTVELGITSNPSVQEYLDTLIVSSADSQAFLYIRQDPAPCSNFSKDSLMSSSITDSSAQLSWGSIQGAVGYTFRYKKLNTSDPWVEIDSLTESHIDLSGLEMATEYWWAVRIDCGGLISEWTDDTFQTEEFCPRPLAGSSEVGGDSTVAIFWEASSSASRFQIRYRKLSDTLWVESPLITRIDTLLEGLEINDFYEWQLRSFCQSSFSEWSDSDTFQIFVCGDPVGLSVDSLRDASAFVSWVPGTNNDFFHIRYREADSSNIWRKIVSISDTFFLIDSLTAEITYEWELRALCSNDTLSWISGGRFLTPGPPSVEITFPTDRAKVGTPFSLQFSLSNWMLQEGVREMRLFVNGADSGAVFSLEPILINTLPEGSHSLRLQLAEAGGDLINVQDSIIVEVIANPSLSLSPPFLFFPPNGDTLEAFVFGDIAWEFLPTRSWVHLSSLRGEGNDTVQIWTDPNQSFADLSDTLILVAGALRDSLIVFQSRAECQPVRNPRTLNTQDSSVVFSWTPNDQSVGFEIRFKEDDSSSFWTLIDTLTQPSFELRDLLPGTNYLWQVRNDCGPFKSDWGDSIRFTTVISCIPPQSLRIDSVSNTWVSLSWESQELVNSYFVRYREFGATDWMTPLSLSDSSLTIPTLEFGKDYQWQVRASCGGSFTDWVDGPDFQTTSVVPGCGVPMGLQESQLTDSSVTLSWAPVDSAMYYSLRYKLDSDNLWEIELQVSGTDTTLEGLTPSTSYDWEVRVICLDTLSEWSLTQTFQTPRDSSISCDPPENLQIIYIADSTLRFIWTEVPEALFYELRYSLSADTNWTTLGPFETNVVTVSGLLPDSVYRAEVRVICFPNEFGTEWGSSQQINLPGPNSQCRQPLNPSGRILGEQSLIFEWDPEGAANLYRLRYRPLGTESWMIEDSINTNSKLLSDLLPGTTYEWGIGSLCGDFISLWTEGQNQSTWIAPSIDILSPMDSTTLNEGDTLRFELGVRDDDGFVVSIQLFSNGSLLQEIPGDTSFFVWPNVPRGFYQIYAVATDNNGLTRTSDTLTITVGLDLENIILSEFEVSENEPCKVETEGLLITDISVGALTYEWSFGEGATPTSSTEKGPHRVRYSSSGVKTIKLKIQNAEGAIDSSEQIIEVFVQPPRPFAGNDTTICEGGYRLQASAVSDGSGLWEVLSGSAVIDSVNEPNSFVSGLRMGNNVLRWRAISGTCESEADTLVLTRIRCAPKTPEEISGPDTLCIGDTPSSFVFSVPADTSADKYTWVTPPGIQGDIDANTLVINSFSGDGGNIQVIVENEIGESNPVSKFVTIDSCLTPAAGEFQLKEFGAFLKGEQVILDWLVSFDQRIQSYSIEKSTDSIIFELLETIDADKLSLAEIKYRTVDQTPIQGKTYYRLRITKSSGEEVLSEVIVLRLGVDIPPGEVSVSPNPLNGQSLEVAIQSLEPGDILLTITNSSGQKLYKRIHGVTAGFTSITVDTIGWPRGILFVSILQFNSLSEIGFKIQKESD